MLKFIFYTVLFLNNNVNGLILNPINNKQFMKQKKDNKPSIRMQEPSYDIARLINNLAKRPDMIDSYNVREFLNEVQNKHIEAVSLIKDINTNGINALVAVDNQYNSDLPELPNLHYLETGLDKVNSLVLDSLLNNDIYYKIVQTNNNPMSGLNIPNLIINAVLFYFLFNFLLSLFQQFRGGNGGGFGGPMNPMNAGKLQSKGLIKSEDINTSFDDVAGCNEAKYELQEVVDFLKNPEKFETAGAKVPKGVLLEGPPGTGKTLLARAVAGEADVSFIQISASEFIQMFVGVGASRVRDLFKLARENSPCVIFIDEIDAVGRKRGEQFGGGGNEEREQTLNQILTNMDGFEKTESVVVLAATNRADILDSALTRSGRFDRKIQVGLPDTNGRRKILDVHLRDKFVEPSTDLDEIAALTGGFSGADIENMANEAAILALRQNKTLLNSSNLVDAFEKIVIGLPKLSKETNKNEERLVAYHEAGHTLMALLFKEFFDVRKVTINANTNGAGGYTLFTPKEQYSSYATKKYILANLIVTMGGRAAEIILFNKIVKNDDKIQYNNDKLFRTMKDLDVTSGASQDLKQADNLIRNYIQIFGIEEMDNVNFSKIIQSPQSPYITLSESSKSTIDDYVLYLTNFGLKTAINIIESNIDVFNKLSNDLIIKRSVDIKYLNELNVTYF
jgi:cell division protease FtsH